MKKKIAVWLAVFSILLLLLPWAAVTYVPRQAGMLVCLLFLYVVNPVYFLATGIWAGKGLGSFWKGLVLVLLGGLLSLPEEVWFWGMGNFSFGYTGAYVALGCLALGLCRWKLPKWTAAAVGAGALILCLLSFLVPMPGRASSVPPLSELPQLDEGELNSRLHGYELQQLEQAWGPAASAGESQAVWEIDENTLLYANLKPNGTAVTFSLGRK